MKIIARSLVPLAVLVAAGTVGALLAAFPTFDAFTVGQVGNNMGQTSLVDVDRDGDLDWMVGDRGTAWWFEYQAPGTWVQHTIGTSPATDVGGTAFDVDGDGWVDHVTSGAWFRNPRSPRTSAFARFSTGGITNSHDSIAADVDGDGKLDVVGMNDGAGLYWYKIPSDPTQPWTGTRVGDGVHGGISPRGAGDLDGDGDTDIVRSTGWFENTGKGASWVWHGNLAAGGHGGQYPNTTKSWIADLDKDGDNDVVMTDADVFTFDARVHWFENADGRGLTWKEHVVATKKGDLHTLALADFDNDGDLDIFSGEGPGGGTGAGGARRWFIWENTDGRGGTWAEHLIRENAAECHEGVAADVDKDGDIDLCSKPWNGNLHVYLRNNLNPGTVQSPAAPSNLSASAVSSSQINLSWTDNASNETGFKIERKTGAGGAWSQIATVGANVTSYSNTDLSASTTYYYRVRANNAAGDSAYSNEANATTPAAPPPPGNGTGLRADYYDNMDFTALKVTRTDEKVDFDWGTGSPDPSLGADTFSVRWTGRVQAAFSETYAFYVKVDDGARLWVDGKMIVDKWFDQAPTEWSGTVALEAGRLTDLWLEYYENGGGASISLSWSSASQPKGLVPRDRLFPYFDARDNDGDGIPNGMDPDDDNDGIEDRVDLDRDGDGIANDDETAAGSDPDDRDSVPGGVVDGGGDGGGGKCGSMGLDLLGLLGLAWLVRRRLTFASAPRPSHG